jgi:excisionase family DNA binding protein
VSNFPGGQGVNLGGLSQSPTRTSGSPRDARPAGLSADRLAYSVEEAAKVIGVGRTLTWALVRSGDIPSVRVAGRVLIRRRQLIEWLDTRSETIYPSS